MVLPGALRLGELLLQQAAQAAALLLHQLEGEVLQRVEKRVEEGLGDADALRQLRQVQAPQAPFHGDLKSRVQQRLPHPGPVLLRIALAGHGVPSSHFFSIAQRAENGNRRVPGFRTKNGTAALQRLCRPFSLTPPAWACPAGGTWSSSPPGGCSHTRCTGTGGRRGACAAPRPCTPFRSPGSPPPSG